MADLSIISSWQCCSFATHVIFEQNWNCVIFLLLLLPWIHLVIVSCCNLINYWYHCASPPFSHHCFEAPTKCIIGFHNVNHEDSKYETQNLPNTICFHDFDWGWKFTDTVTITDEGDADQEMCCRCTLREIQTKLQKIPMKFTDTVTIADEDDADQEMCCRCTPRSGCRTSTPRSDSVPCSAFAWTETRECKSRKIIKNMINSENENILSS